MKRVLGRLGCLFLPVLFSLGLILRYMTGYDHGEIERLDEQSSSRLMNASLLASSGAPADEIAVSGSTPDTLPDLYVLSVGIGHFRDSRLPPLLYADDDALAIAHAFQQQESQLYGSVHTRLLLETNATRASVIQALLELSRAASPDDVVVVFLSGHGAVEQATGRWHYFTFDTDPANIPGTALEQDALLSYLQLKGRAKRRTLLLVDTCQAGALSDALRAVSGENGRDYLAGEIERLDESSTAEQRKLSIFSAGTSTDRAVEGPQLLLSTEPKQIKGHGAFTRSLLEALTSQRADRNSDGVVTSNEFQRYVAAATRATSNGKQQPDFSGDVADVILVGVKTFTGPPHLPPLELIDERYRNPSSTIHGEIERLETPAPNRVPDLILSGLNGTGLSSSRIQTEWRSALAFHPGLESKLIRLGASSRSVVRFKKSAIGDSPYCEVEVDVRLSRPGNEGQLESFNGSRRCEPGEEAQVYEELCSIGMEKAARWLSGQLPLNKL